MSDVDYYKWSVGLAPKPPSTSPSAAPSPDVGSPVAEQRIELAGKKAALGEEEVKKLTEMQNAVMRESGRKTYVPPDPKFAPVPPHPKIDFTDPIKALQNPAVIIATLGSLFTRAPATAALNAGAAAMEAYHKGEAETFKQKQQEWKDATEEMLAKNKIAMDKLNNEWRKSEVSVKDRTARLMALAAGEKMEGVIYAIKSAKFEDVDKILEGLQKADEEARKSVELMNRQKEMADYRAKVSEDIKKGDAKSIADGIVNGTQPPVLTGIYREGPYVRAALAESGFDLTKAQLEWTRAQKQIQALNGPQMQRFFALAHSVDNTIGRVRELSHELELSGIPLLNRTELEILMQTQGNTKEGQLATHYITAVNTLKEEFANLAQGGYAPTESVWGLANRQLNENYGVKQMDSSLSEIQRLIKYRMGGFTGMSEFGPGAPNRYGGAQQKPASNIGLQEWLPQARAANPGVSDEELTDYYRNEYGD